MLGERRSKQEIQIMIICDKCRKQSGTITIYGFGKFKDALKYTFDLCEPCAKEVEQKIKEFINNDR